MRAYCILPALLLCVACGARLTEQVAAKKLAEQYPVDVCLGVPDMAKPLKGSPQLANVLKLEEHMIKMGWFTVARNGEGERERFLFKPKAGSTPKEMRETSKGWEIPAAKGEFVKVTHMHATHNGAKVKYQVRLTQPTPYFEVFKALYPSVKLEDIKERHAFFRKEQGVWTLYDTDEVFKKNS